MLARGALCRLAADVPKTSTHDLPRISQLLRTSLFARHGASQPTVGAIARAFRATILQGRRAYATKSATEPTARVKKEVKKAVAAKKPAAKTTTAKKPAPKKPARKTALKKKPAPKKPAAKKPKKVRTAEEVQVEQIRALKKRALLRGVPKRPHASAWNAFASEALKGSKNIADSQTILKETSVKYRNLTPAEREHYNQLGIQNAEAKLAEYNKWINSYTPEEIADANFARTVLKRKLGPKFKTVRLIDDRHDTSARKTPYIRFSSERLSSGDFQGIAFGEKAKLVANEWKALGASEKKVYEDEFAAAKAAKAAKVAA